jgi:hypothetical protein
MKVMVLNFRKNKKISKARKTINFERLMFKVFIAVFVVLLGVQAALMNPAIRSAVTVRNSMEGSPLGQEEYLYLEGSMELQLIGEENNPNLKVLVNGEEMACFDQGVVEIAVADGDIVELDGSEIANTAKVTVTSVSTNMEGDYKGRIYNVDNGIKRIGRVRITES